MSNDASTPSSFHFVVLEAEECRGLPRVKHVGRIVWLDGDQPMALPVNFALDGDTILFRTSPDSVIAAVAQQRAAAFEVDEIDEFTGTGWSVLATGAPRPVEQGELPRSLYDRPRPWAPGSKDLYIGLDVQRLSGRRIESHL